ncbi:MAG: autoinducer binding domain-containing protein [Gammaproteobacteria bacterium]
MRHPFDFGTVRSLDRALDALADHALALGFDAVDYGYLPRARRQDGGMHAPDIRSRRFPPRWERGWARYASEDPYLHVCYAGNLPLDWNEVKGAHWLTATQREAIGFIDGLGFRDGVTVPVHLGDGRFAFVSGLCRAARGAWRNAEQVSVEGLFILAHSFHAAVAPLALARPASDAAPLTRREREVLAHAAQGRSAPATALAMRRARETVRRQRKSAMAKLGAHTITAAVARALALGLI